MFTALQWSHNRPKLTLLLLAILTAVFALGIRQLEVRNSFAGELPAQDPINIDIDRVKEHFGERSILLIGLEADNIYNEETAQKIKAISEDLVNVPHVLADEILSLSTLQNISNREWGLNTDGFLEELPEDEAGWQQLRADVEANDVILGQLVSKDATLTVVAAALADGFEGGVVYDAVEALTAQYTGPEKVHITGAPILVEDVQRGISGDSRKFIPIAILLIFCGFYLCFRRLSGVLLPVGMVIMSIVWTMGAMGYLGLPVTVVSNALPVIMVAVASSYGIHFMNTYYSLAPRHTKARELAEATVQKIGKPILITGATSALGSASLLIFQITSLREFGIIGAVGFSFATLICLSLLPALCALLRVPQGAQREYHGLNRRLQALTLWAQSNRRWVWGVYALLLPFCLYQASNIQVGDDYLKFFPASHSGRIAAETFNDRLGGVRVMDITVDASTYGDIKSADFYQDLTNFQDYLSGLEHVGKVYSYHNVIRHLQTNLQEEKTTAPSSEEIAQYLMLHEMSAAPGEVFALRTEDYQRAKVQVFLKSSQPEEHQVLYDKIKMASPTFFTQGTDVLSFGGDVMHRIALGSYIVKGKIQNIILALLIVLVSCWLIFRSFNRALLTLLPIVASLIMVFGGMGIIGIRLGISTSLLTAMIVGVGIDFAVHYLVAFFKARKESNHQNALAQTSSYTGKAIAYDAISNIVGFSVLSFSGFLPVQHFGWLLAFSMLLIFINTMVLYPALLGQSAVEAGASSHAQYGFSN